MVDVEPRRRTSLESPYASTRRVVSPTTGLMLAAAVAAATFVIAFDSGGFWLTSRHAVAICLLWLLALGFGLGFWPRTPLPVATFVVGGLLAAFAVWTGLSLIWSPSVERSFAELD